jgi:putative peptide zinc metalloprotease protein
VRETLPIDDREEGESYIVIGRNGGHFRVSASARQLLRMVDAGLGFPEMAEQLAAASGRRYSPAELEEGYQRIVGQIEESDRASSGRLPAAFWFKRTLLPEGVVRALAGRLAAAFRPAVALPALLAIATAAVLLFRTNPDPRIAAATFWPAYGLFVASLLVHELGHAAACARYGAPPSDIGVTMYLVYPAFYSDVTSAWRLRRWQRVVVDLGGNYFQLAVGAVYATVYLATGAAACRGAFLLILYGAAFSLNPIFKFDGYWVLADALGVVHLGRQPLRIVRHLLLRLLGRPVEPLPWPRSVIAALAVYTPLSLAFWLFFLTRLVPALWQHSARLPGELARAIGALQGVAEGEASPWLAWKELGVSIFFLLISYWMLFRLLRAALDLLRRALRHRSAPAADPAADSSSGR